MTEPLNITVITDDEVSFILGCDLNTVSSLHETWIKTFVSNGGTRLLLGILHGMIKNAHDGDGIQKAKVEKDCWNSMLKILRILLTAAFSTVVSSSELSLALQRRISQSS